MIKKLISIKAVGLFDQSFPAVEFKRFNIIYGENGRGKSTLSAVFRSLRSNEPSFIQERYTLTSLNSQEANIMVNGSNYIFKDGKWNKWLPELEIFDSFFINNNVYSGNDIGIDHRKNLHRFVIGQEGVKYANAVDRIDRSLRAITDKISKQEIEIEHYIKGDCLSISEFINLALIEDIDTKIKNKRKEIEILKKANEVSEKRVLEYLSIPAISKEKLENILKIKINNIHKDVERIIHEHISMNMDCEGEKWVESGLKYIKNDECPFCRNSLLDNNLIEIYKSYFDEIYIAYKKEISDYLAEIEELHSEANLLKIQDILISNDMLVEFWKEYINFEYLSISFREMESTWNKLCLEIETYLKKKEANPNEPLELKQDVLVAFRLYKFLLSSLETYNHSIKEINLKIGEKKHFIEHGDLEEAKRDLEILENQKIRSRPDLIALCDHYRHLINGKSFLNKRKIKSKKSLDEYTSDIFTSYETSINKYLNLCGAGFRIADPKTIYSGGKPSASFRILINETPVDLSSPRDSINKPCFKNTLSEGDKSTLAFVFFLSKLEQDPNLSNKIIVFDDPVSSLDTPRRNFTQQQIINLGQKCKQIILLTHDLSFARLVFDDLRYDKCTLQILRKGSFSILEKWDLESSTRSGYFKNYFSISDFLEQGPRDDNHMREIVRCIRPLLEGYLRMKFPKQFKSEEWLGDFIKKVRLSGNGEPLYAIRDKLTEISEINDYSKKYHHENPGADSEPITDTELRAFAERTIRVIQN